MTTVSRSSTWLAALAAAATFALGGCASDVNLNHKAPVQAQTATPVGALGAGGASAQGAGQSSVAAVQTGGAEGQGAGGPNSGPTADVGRSVYFAYDSYSVDPRYQATMQGNAQYLASHSAAHAQLQGNTDARGSREYNLALGQKRADAVRQGLELLGVKPNQMEAISFGKEKPKATGDSPQDFAENRRVDIVYQP